MLLIAGLGNPGSKYINTRHNIGAGIIDLLRNETLPQISTKVLLWKPSKRFMNEVGLELKSQMDFYKIKPEELLVIHDDLDLPLGAIRFSFQRSSAGHKGVDSIIEQLGTNAFYRMRVGINKPIQATPPTSYVLEKFSSDETQNILENIPRWKQAIYEFISNGGQAAMNKYN